MLTGVSLFAGVGGFDLAMQRQGVKVVASVEIDKKCQEVLAHRFPESKILDDVTTVKGSDLIEAGFNPSKGIITGGFPCQDLSVAGKRAGLAGARSGLFWEIARIVEETQTEYFIIENVPGLLSSNNGADFGVILGTMGDLGYSIGWRVLDAQYFGVPQRRRRVFIVGRRSTSGGIAEILFKSEGLRRDTATSQQERQHVTSSATKSPVIVFHPHYHDGARVQGDTMNTLTSRMGTGGNNVSGVATPTNVRRLTPVECERLQGFPDDWTVGQADSHRYKQLGNAVAVPVVEWLVRGISMLD